MKLQSELPVTIHVILTKVFEENENHISMLR